MKKGIVFFIFICLVIIALLIWLRLLSNLFPVIQNGKWGYIDKAGRIVINPKFDLALPFSKGLACIKIDNKWGYIDKKGKIRIDTKFDLAFPFSKGLAFVKIDDSYGYIDKKGKYIWAPTIILQNLP